MQTALPIHVFHEIPNFFCPSENEKIWVFDAQTEEEMQRIAEITVPAAEQTTFAGCAGFAEFLARQTADGVRDCAEKLLYAGKRILLCGSINERTRQQIDYAVQKGVAHLCLQPDDYLSDTLPESTVQRLRRAADRDGSLLLYTARTQEDIRKARRCAEKRGIDGERLNLRIAAGLGRIAKFCLALEQTDIFSVVGGDTLYGVVRSSGIRSLELCREILPGVILSRILLQNGVQKHMLSKAGSFGGEDILWQMTVI